MVGDVFVVNGEAHAVMLMGFERFEVRREGDTLILHGRQNLPPIFLPNNSLDVCLCHFVPYALYSKARAS